MIKLHRYKCKTVKYYIIKCIVIIYYLMLSSSGFYHSPGVFATVTKSLDLSRFCTIYFQFNTPSRPFKFSNNINPPLSKTISGDLPSGFKSSTDLMLHPHYVTLYNIASPLYTWHVIQAIQGNTINKSLWISVYFKF